MNKNDIIGLAFIMSPIILVLLFISPVVQNETKKAVACIEAGMEWIDGDCVKGEKE